MAKKETEINPFLDQEPGKAIQVDDFKKISAMCSPQEETTQDKVKSICDRMFVSQRRHSIEGQSIKNQVRAYLYALELKELGVKAEDIK